MSSRQGIGQYERDKTWVGVGPALERPHRTSIMDTSGPAAPRSPQRWVAVKGIRRPRVPRPVEPIRLDPEGVGVADSVPRNPDWESASAAQVPRAPEAVLEPTSRVQARECVEIVASRPEPASVRADPVVTTLSRPLPWTTRALRIVITRSNGRRRWALDVLVRRPPAAWQRSI